MLAGLELELDPDGEAAGGSERARGPWPVGGTRSSLVVRTNRSLQLAILAVYISSDRQLQRSSLTGLQSAHMSPSCRSHGHLAISILLSGASTIRFAARTTFLARESTEALSCGGDRILLPVPVLSVSCSCRCRCPASPARLVALCSPSVSKCQKSLHSRHVLPCTVS